MVFTFSLHHFGQDSGRVLSLRLEIVELNKSKRTLTLRRTITNRGKKNVVVDKNLLGYESSFVRSKTGRSNAVDSEGIGRSIVAELGPSYEGNFVILGSNRSYSDQTNIDLSDGFFIRGHSYDYSVSYGQFRDEIFGDRSVWKGLVPSNVVRFRL